MSYGTGISVILYLLSALLVEQQGLDARAGVIPFTLFAMVAHFVLFRGLARRLSELDIALHHLLHNKPMTGLEPRQTDSLKPLVEKINGLIRERSDLQTMRGQLVEQISASAAQEERNRLARDLHDSIKQQVFSMSISAAAAHAHLDSNPAAAREALLDVKQSAQEAMVEMRALLQQLSPAPLEKSGLVQALREQCEALSYRTGAQVETRFGSLPPDDRLPPGTHEVLFRIAQEALSNIARHARAGRVEVEMDTDEEQRLILRLTDNGQGFNMQTQPVGMGLSNIRTRAASIGADVDLQSREGSGTTLTISVSLVNLIDQEVQMQKHYEQELNPIIALYYRFAGGSTAFVVAFSLLMWRLLGRADGFGEDTVVMLISIGLIATSIIAVPFAIWSLMRARAQSTPLILAAGRNSHADLKLRRHVALAYLIVCLAVAWFVPIFLLAFPINEWLRVAVGVLFLGIALWYYRDMYKLYKAELAMRGPSERAEELGKRVAELRTSWITVIVLIPLVLFSSVIQGEIRLPPQNPDHWMNVSFVTLAFLLLINQILSWIYYRRWRQEADQQRKAA
jgi:signal transduction histidine kinase